MRERYDTMGASKNRQRNPKRSNSKRRAVVFEPLEPRLLLSADLAFGSDGHHAQYADEGWERRGAGTGPAFSDTSFHSADYDPDPLAAPDPHLQPEANSQYWPLPDPLDLIALRSLEDQREQGASTETASPADNAVSYELVLVDASVQGYETLVSDLMAQDDEARRIQIHVLNTATDGIEQVSEILSGYRGLDAVHVISHGDQTGLDLGNGRLDASSLERDREALQSWADALTDDADLLLYGCNLAVSPDGAALLVALGELIGVDVAASSDLTGSAVLGGDWDLEFEAGSIEAGVVLGAQAQQRWNGVLASFTVNDTSDTVDTNPGDGLAQDASGNTTLRAAVMEANALAGADVINVPAGTYFLTLDGDDEFAALGDLDLWGNQTFDAAADGRLFISELEPDEVQTRVVLGWSSHIDTVAE